MKVAVIGSGIMGSSIAFRLQRLGGMEVTLVDRSEPGSGTTGASFAWINANRKLPEAYFELNVAGMREHVTLARELGRDHWLHRTGNLMCAAGKEASELRARVERLRSWGYEARLLEGRDARQLEPEVRFPEKDGKIAYFPEEAWVDAPALARSLAQAAGRAGARMRFGDRLAGIEVSGGAVEGISLGSGESLEVDAVVNACGPGAEAVAAMAGLSLEVEVKSGLLARLETRRHPIKRLLHTDRVNLRPEPLGGLLLHHDSVDKMLWEGEGEEEELAELLLERARAIAPELEHARVADWTVGLRPTPGDGLPCVGAVPERAGYYEAVTHSGVTLGPVLGRLLAEEISSGEPPSSLNAMFRASRFRRRRP